RKQLTANGGMNLSPAISPDGKYVVFVSMQNDKRNVWRVNLDGRNSVRLTSGLMDSLPRFRRIAAGLFTQRSRALSRRSGRYRLTVARLCRLQTMLQQHRACHQMVDS